jgi:hypothetical protein
VTYPVIDGKTVESRGSTCCFARKRETAMNLKSLTFGVFASFGLAGAAMACPDPSMWGESYSVTGSQLRGGVYVDVVAGGENYIWNWRHIRPGTDQGAGYFTTPPDFTIELNGIRGYRLDISVVSECDSALLINTSSGNWYYDDDDNGNLDPKIVLTRPIDGYLDLWIGTYDGAYCDARLYLDAY